MSDRPLPRYTMLPFPAYSYVPGSGTPHPVSNPHGHMYGHVADEVAPLDPQDWQQNETYLYAVDLFNHGYYWEAHEAWESLWHAAGRKGQVAVFLKGLIKLAAAGVKSREGNSVGIHRHLNRAKELLSSIDEQDFAGMKIPDLMGQADQHGLRVAAEFSATLVLAPLPP
jgi:uncharacterized protein